MINKSTNQPRPTQHIRLRNAFFVSFLLRIVVPTLLIPEGMSFLLVRDRLYTFTHELNYRKRICPTQSHENRNELQQKWYSTKNTSDLFNVLVQQHGAKMQRHGSCTSCCVQPFSLVVSNHLNQRHARWNH